MDSVHDDRAGVEPITGLCRFRDGFYSCLGARADAQFELTEALLCADGPVRSLVDLSLAPEHRRGHGALYDGLNHGSIEVARLRRGVAGLPLPRVGDRIVLAADVSPWLRPDAETSAARLFCHVHGRAKGTAQMIPGWPYSVVAALGSGRHQLDRDAGRGPPRARRRRDRGDRRAAARGGGSAARGRALAPGRPGHLDRARLRLRRHPAGVPAGRPAGDG